MDLPRGRAPQLEGCQALLGGHQGAGATSTLRGSYGTQSAQATRRRGHKPHEPHITHVRAGSMRVYVCVRVFVFIEPRLFEGGNHLHARNARAVTWLIASEDLAHQHTLTGPQKCPAPPLSCTMQTQYPFPSPIPSLHSSLPFTYPFPSPSLHHPFPSPIPSLHPSLPFTQSSCLPAWKTRTFSYKHAGTEVCTHTCTQAQMPAYRHTCTHTDACIHAHMHTHTHMLAYIHVHAHAHMHKSTRTPTHQEPF